MANLVETLADTGSFKTLLQAVETAGVRETLETPGPFAVLAPTDEAFAQLPPETWQELQTDPTKLQKVVMYHVLFGDVRSDDLGQIDEAPTVEGSVVAVNHANGTIQVNDATVIQSDILTDNGVIHMIDTVLVPALIAGH